MATSAKRRPAEDTEASTPTMTTPSHMGMAHGMDAVFVWTQLTEVQKTLGTIDAKLDQHKESVTKLDNDLAKIKADVAEFKQIRHTAKVIGWIVGAAVTVVLALAGYIFKEAWSVFKPQAMQAIQTAPAAPPKPGP